jgi:hypothetical protein
MILESVMTSDDFLINNAYQNVWCVPEQDRQTILRPARITPPAGGRGSVKVLWQTFNLPTEGPRYHVFQFGNIALSTLGLDIPVNVWTSANVQMVENEMLIDVYLERGIMIPRNKVYFLTTTDGNLVVAIEQLSFLTDLGSQEPYFRFYSNAYFDRSDVSKIDDGVEYHCEIPNSASAVSALGFKYNDMKTRSGDVLIYVNGWMVNNITSATVIRGDVVEMVRDASIIRIEHHAVSDLSVFLSELDECQKYLIHPLVHEDDSIYYRDDQDFYLMRRLTPNVHRGVLYHKNQEDAVRMVTHRDYSIPTHYVERFCNQNSGWALSHQLIVKLIIRRSGMDKELINEAHHIKELYQFEGADWYRAVIGANAVVDVWRVENLEQSMYTALMRAPNGGITREMVEEAYGYNTISRLIADTPQKFTPGSNWVKLPFGLRGESTVYEYDGTGRLIDWHHNQNTQYYIPKSSDCAYIEAVAGRGSDVLSTVYGKDYTVPDGLTYRCYVCTSISGFPQGDWRDVTDDHTYYEVNGRTVNWKTNPNDTYTAIKMDDTFLTYTLNLDYQDKLLRFSLNVKELRVNGNLYNGLVEIPSGILELWLNGHALIKDLDWYKVGKEICIVNRQYRNQGAGGDNITIRATGFCLPDMSEIEQAEFGFVEAGILSRNNRWNLRDDKVIRVVADGRLWSREDLDWAEDRPTVLLNNVRNGAPYAVIEPIIPLHGLSIEDVQAMRQQAIDTDTAIEDYMSLYVDEIDVPEFNPVSTRHQIYSPFVSKLMHDLQDGFFDQIDLVTPYTDNQLRQWVDGYVWLLEYEPTRREVDERYVAIHPHESDQVQHLNIYHYNFLARAIRVMLDDKIDITNSIVIDNPA